MTLQHTYRKKYQKILCPQCNSTSRVEKELTGGFQLRVCKKGHNFAYDYTCEMLCQTLLNWKCGIDIKKILKFDTKLK